MSIELIIVLVCCGAMQVVLVILWVRLLTLSRRHTAMGLEVTRMLAMHQDYASSFDARLRALGSRTAGDAPIPTAEEMTGGRWMR